MRRVAASRARLAEACTCAARRGGDRRDRHGCERQPGRVLLAVVGLGRACLPRADDDPRAPRTDDRSGQAASRPRCDDRGARSLDRSVVVVVREPSRIDEGSGASARLRRCGARSRVCRAPRRRGCGPLGGARGHCAGHRLRPCDEVVPRSLRHLRGPGAALPTRGSDRVLERARAARRHGDRPCARARCACPSGSRRGRSRSGRAGARCDPLLHVQPGRVGRASRGASSRWLRSILVVFGFSGRRSSLLQRRWRPLRWRHARRRSRVRTQSLRSGSDKVIDWLSSSSS